MYSRQMYKVTGYRLISEVFTTLPYWYVPVGFTGIIFVVIVS